MGELEPEKDVTHHSRGMYGLLGPNGAGKSTLMHAVATLQEPDMKTAAHTLKLQQ